MAKRHQPVYRCPHCHSIRISTEDLGGPCPRCDAPLPAELQPAYRIGHPNPFRRQRPRSVDQGMLGSLLVLTSMVLFVLVAPLPQEDLRPLPHSFNALTHVGSGT